MEAATVMAGVAAMGAATVTAGHSAGDGAGDDDHDDHGHEVMMIKALHAPSDETAITAGNIPTFIALTGYR